MLYALHPSRLRWALFAAEILLSAASVRPALPHLMTLSVICQEGMALRRGAAVRTGAGWAGKPARAVR